MKYQPHKFNYRWTLKDAAFTKDKGKVFSCFACGGGSSMGYKLSGYDVIGCNEIDPRMMYTYCQNHNPRFNFMEPIQTFKLRDDLPDELYQLDILDGSPPCSTFSIAGSREDAWGVEKKFREGQASQVLDTLFFDFIDLAKRLQPKVVIAENVKGLLLGEAQKYVARIYDEFDKAGYMVQHFLLNGATMGVPQRRERVFFVCLRKDLCAPFLKQVNLFEEKPALEMEFNEAPILYREIMDDDVSYPIPPSYKKCWDRREYNDKCLADIAIRYEGVDKFFNVQLEKPDMVLTTITGKQESTVAYHKPSFLSDMECILGSSFPMDYNFCGQRANYICGMSVPPLMMAQVSNQVWLQWLSKI